MRVFLWSALFPVPAIPAPPWCPDFLAFFLEPLPCVPIPRPCILVDFLLFFVFILPSSLFLQGTFENFLFSSYNILSTSLFIPSLLLPKIPFPTPKCFLLSIPPRGG